MFDRTAIAYYVALVDEGGSAEAVDLTRLVEAFTFTDREGGMDRLSLTVFNDDLANFDDPVFEYGAKLRIAFSNGRSSSPTRDVVIRKVTGGRRLTVEAVSKDGALLDTVKRTRRFENMRRSEVAAEIAKENGFSQPDIEETPEVFESIAQGNLTDGQLLRKLATLEGFEFYVDFDGLHWHRRRVDQAPIREYIYFTDPDGGEIIDFNIDNDITRRPGKVTVKSRDPLTKEDIVAVASNSEDADRDVLAGYSGTIDGEEGLLVVKKEVVHEITVPSNVETQADAEREAKGRYRKAQQGAVKMTLELRGDPALVAKSIIQVSGMGRRVSGKYYVKEVVHALTASGGYDMSAKLITDGFQGGKGKGNGANAGDGAGLSAAAERLRLAGYNDMSVGIDGETGDLTGDLGQSARIQKQSAALAEALTALGTQGGDQLATNANRAAKALTQLSSAARKAGAVNTADTAAESAALCRRLATNPEEIKAKGKTNTKDVSQSDVRAVQTVDADGNPTTTYVNTGGREK